VGDIFRSVGGLSFTSFQLTMHACLFRTIFVLLLPKVVQSPLKMLPICVVPDQLLPEFLPETMVCQSGRGSLWWHTEGGPVLSGVGAQGLRDTFNCSMPPLVLLYLEIENHPCAGAKSVATAFEGGVLYFLCVVSPSCHQ
jgi:hypothetical protein